MYSSHILLQFFGSAQVSADVTDLRTALALATAAECEEVAAQIRNDLAESKKKDKAAITVLKQEFRTKRAAAAEEAKKRRKAAAKAKAEARAKAKAAGRRMRMGVAP